MNPTLIFLGRLSANKRPDHAIDAFRLVKKKIPNAVLWIVGSGPMEKKLRKNCPEDVYFLGKVSEIEKNRRLAASGALLCTSVREGWGMVVTEAASYGTISISYEVDGLKDSINHSGGILCEPDPSSLATAVCNYFTNQIDESILKKVSPLGVTSWNEVSLSILSRHGDLD